MFLFFTCFQLTDAAILPVKLSCEIYAHSDQQGDLCGMSVNGDASRATAQEVLNQIAKSYLQIVESSTKKEFNEFMEYLTRMGEGVSCRRHKRELDDQSGMPICADIE